MNLTPFRLSAFHCIRPHSWSHLVRLQQNSSRHETHTISALTKSLAEMPLGRNPVRPQTGRFQQSRPKTCTVTVQPATCTLKCSAGWGGFRNTQISMLLGMTQKRNVRSKFWWFTRSCNSHYVSHFAAFFIVVGSKTSIAESCNELDSQQYPYEGHC